MKRLILFFYFSIFLLFLFPSPVYANNNGDCWGPYVEEGNVATIQGLECIFIRILNIATSLAGLAVFIMLLIGGFKYLTSGGDPKATQSAKDTLTHAIFGLVLVIAAWFILQFIEEFTGVKVTIFKIPGAD